MKKIFLTFILIISISVCFADTTIVWEKNTRVLWGIFVSSSTNVNGTVNISGGEEFGISGANPNLFIINIATKTILPSDFKPTKYMLTPSGTDYVLNPNYEVKSST